MKEFIDKSFSVFAKEWALVTAGDMDSYNTMTIAWGGLGTIIGTLVGFLGGIYFPVGQLSAPIAAVMKCTPVLYGAALFREEMTREILGETFRGIPAEAVEEFREIMGISLSVQGHKLSGWEEIAVLLVCGVLFLAGGAAVVKFGKRSDR